MHATLSTNELAEIDSKRFEIEKRPWIYFNSVANIQFDDGNTITIDMDNESDDKEVFADMSKRESILNIAAFNMQFGFTNSGKIPTKIVSGHAYFTVNDKNIFETTIPEKILLPNQKQTLKSFSLAQPEWENLALTSCTNVCKLDYRIQITYNDFPNSGPKEYFTDGTIELILGRNNYGNTFGKSITYNELR